jgi:Flp pilus assembly pilin Flp
MTKLDETLPILCRAEGTSAREAEHRLWARELGASMVEYILLVALIALAVIGAVTFLSQQTDSKFNDAGNKIRTAGTSAAKCDAGDQLLGTGPDGVLVCQTPTRIVYYVAP